MTPHLFAHLLILACILIGFLWIVLRKEKPPGGPKKP